MDPPKEGFSMEQSTKRGRGRLRRAVIESQPSGGSSSIPLLDEGMKGISEPARPSTHGRRPSIIRKEERWYHETMCRLLTIQ